MARFFVEKSIIADNSVTIKGEDAHHISRVLRMREGDKITICDCEGMDYYCIIETIAKSEVVVQVVSSEVNQTEPTVDIMLFQGIPKQGKMEVIIQKAVEMGVRSIIPVVTHRCVAKGDKPERWKKVVLEAAKQCGRGRIPEVCEAVSFNEAVKRMAGMECKIMPYELETEGRLKDVLGSAREVGILIGPEGGFEEYEAEAARAAGIKTVTLGKRILRTETAASAVIPIILYTMGEM